MNDVPTNDIHTTPRQCVYCDEVASLVRVYRGTEVWFLFPAGWWVRAGAEPRIVCPKCRHVLLRPASATAGPTYPDDWPRCPGCGAPALDGHITCGKLGCNEHGRH